MTGSDVWILGGAQTDFAGARTFATLNIGGSTAATVSFIVPAGET